MGADRAAAASADALRAIASPPPALAEADLRSLLLERYGLEGELQSLLSERDQNVAVKTAGGERFVLKIANVAEDPVVTDFQVRALLHLEAQQCAVATPRIVPTVDGSVSAAVNTGDKACICRVVTYLAGAPITGTRVTEQAARNIGSSLAHLDAALADFAHPGDSQPLLWDMQRALEIRPLVRFVSDTALRETISASLDNFETKLLPYMQATDRQVIHGDLNPGNILLGADGVSVTGIIDFGDMVRAPVAVDLAIAASYLRGGGADPLALVVALVAGYASVLPVTDEALAVLHGMIRTRIATSITLLQWRLQTRGSGDAYSAASVASEDDAAAFLAALNAVSEERFFDRLHRAIN